MKGRYRKARPKPRLTKWQRIQQRIDSAQRHGKDINPKELASCYGKIRYSQEQAKAKAAEIDTMKNYKCQFCPYHHVGRKPWNERNNAT